MGLILPNVVNGRLKLRKGRNNCEATRSPTNIPIAPQNIDAIRNHFTGLLS
jgi:hypothetical protein